MLKRLRAKNIILLARAALYLYLYLHPLFLLLEKKKNIDRFHKDIQKGKYKM